MGEEITLGKTIELTKVQFEQSSYILTEGGKERVDGNCRFFKEKQDRVYRNTWAYR